MPWILYIHIYTLTCISTIYTLYATIYKYLYFVCYILILCIIQYYILYKCYIYGILNMILDYACHIPVCKELNSSPN